MSLDFTKFYMLDIPESKKSSVLVPTERDLSGSYRIDRDKTEELFVYNEDVGISDWGLEVSYPDSETYRLIKDIFPACYGTVHDYRYDTTDGTSYMEYVREVRSVSGALSYYFVSHCASSDYRPPAAILPYISGWDKSDPYRIDECDYETLAINFAYSNPAPEIFRLYQLPVILPGDRGKYLHVSTVDGSLEWANVDSWADYDELMSRLSQITGIPPDHQKRTRT